MTRRKYQLTRAKVGFRNQLESLLEQAHIKLSSFVSDLLGVSGRRMMKALATGETDPSALAVYRRLLKMALEELELIDTHIEQLEREAMNLVQQHQNAVQRVAELPGFGVGSAVQMIAEVDYRRLIENQGGADSCWPR